MVVFHHDYTHVIPYVTSTAPRSGAIRPPCHMRNPACSTWPHANRAVPSRFLASCFRNFAWDFELFLLKRWTFDAFGFFRSPTKGTKVDSELVFDIRDNPKLNIDLEQPWPTKIIYKIISGQKPQAWPNSFRSTAWKVKWLTEYPPRKLLKSETSPRAIHESLEFSGYWSNSVLLVKIEGPVWYTIYHHLPVVKGVNKPLY